jgi:hypothetical protein
MGIGCPFQSVERGWGVKPTTQSIPRSIMSRTYIFSPPSGLHGFAGQLYVALHITSMEVIIFRAIKPRTG